MVPSLPADNTSSLTVISMSGPACGVSPARALMPLKVIWTVKEDLNFYRANKRCTEVLIKTSAM